MRASVAVVLLACLALFWNQVFGFTASIVADWFTHAQTGPGDLLASTLVLTLFVAAGGLLRLLWPVAHLAPVSDGELDSVQPEDDAQGQEPWDFELQPAAPAPRDQSEFDEDDELIIWVELEDEDEGPSAEDSESDNWDFPISDDPR